MSTENWSAATVLYRAMQASPDGRPVCKNSMFGLGARKMDRPDGKGDIFPNPADRTVEPGFGGMSVTPDDVRRLPASCRPKSMGGDCKFPVFSIVDTGLLPHLGFRRDLARPTEHGYVEPARRMLFEDYIAELARTSPRWVKILA